MITTAAQRNVTAPAESLSGPCCHRWRRRGVDRPAPRNRTTTAGPAHPAADRPPGQGESALGYQRSKGELQRLSVHVSATAIRTTLRRRGLDPAPRPTAATWRAFRASAKSRFVGFVPSAALTPVSGDEQLAWSVTPAAIGDQLGHFVNLPGPDRPRELPIHLGWRRGWRRSEVRHFWAWSPGGDRGSSLLAR